jgi:hypothetical protein
MNNDIDDCEYRIITIDSSFSTYLDNTTQNFYINLDEPLRNVNKINVISILINLSNTSSLNVSLDPIYINFNDYNRLIAKKDNNNIYYFDSIIVENSITTGNTTIKNDYNTNDSIYYLNPIEPQLKRFNIRLYDKNNSLILKNNLNRFVMKIGVYYNNRKTTRI